MKVLRETGTRTCIVFGAEPRRSGIVQWLTDDSTAQLHFLAHPTPFCGGGLQAGWFLNTMAHFEAYAPPCL
eukprot:COSAG01_NODE_14049_length_1502_cov_1.454027_2_plen_71_part_00